jgi:TatD DNase family protein
MWYGWYMIDISVNFFSPQLRGKESHLIRKAREAGIYGIVATGTHLECSQHAREIAHGCPSFIRSTAGIHPCSSHVSSLPSLEDIQQWEKLWKDPLIVAVGECGLDYYRYPEHKARQQEIFSWQLEAALRHQKPVFLHERMAFHDMAAMLREFTKAGGKGIVHCFTGSKPQVNSYLDMGLDIGVTGWITDQARNHDLLEAIEHVPLGRLHLETDAPYLLPKNSPPQHSNEPANLCYVAEGVRKAYARHGLSMDLKDIHRETSSNSARFFGWYPLDMLIPFDSEIFR